MSTRMWLEFGGEIQKAKLINLGAKTAVEVELCKKNYHKKDEPATFTWIKVMVVEPADWMMNDLVKGKYISGSGEYSLRSYVDKTGEKRHSAEVRCTGYNVSIPKEGGTVEALAPQAVTKTVVKPFVGENQEPPF